MPPSVAWDPIPLDLVYKEHCYFCTRSLYLFKYFDFNDTIRFYSQTDAPEKYAGRDDVDFEAAMYGFKDGTSYEGYDAFRVLLSHFGVFRPLSFTMEIPPITILGRRIYLYIAANRNRYFTCNVEVGEETEA